MSLAYGTVRVGVLGIEDLMELASDRVTRSLTDQECRQYLHLDRCPTSSRRSANNLFEYYA